MNYFIGMDVQTARGCPFPILHEAGTVVEDGWVEESHPDRMVAALREVLERQNPTQNTMALAIRALRVPLAAPRRWVLAGSALAPMSGEGPRCGATLRGCDCGTPVG